MFNYRYSEYFSIEIKHPFYDAKNPNDRAGNCPDFIIEPFETTKKVMIERGLIGKIFNGVYQVYQSSDESLDDNIDLFFMINPKNDIMNITNVEWKGKYFFTNNLSDEADLSQKLTKTDKFSSADVLPETGNQYQLLSFEKDNLKKIKLEGFDNAVNLSKEFLINPNQTTQEINIGLPGKYKIIQTKKDNSTTEKVLFINDEMKKYTSCWGIIQIKLNKHKRKFTLDLDSKKSTWYYIIERKNLLGSININFQYSKGSDTSKYPENLSFIEQDTNILPTQLKEKVLLFEEIKKPSVIEVYKSSEELSLFEGMPPSLSINNTKAKIPSKTDKDSVIYHIL